MNNDHYFYRAFPIDQGLYQEVKSECTKLLKVEAETIGTDDFDKTQLVFSAINWAKTIMFSRVRVIAMECEDTPHASYDALKKISSIVKASDEAIDEFLEKRHS